MKSTLMFLLGLFVAILFNYFIDVSFWVEAGVVGLIIVLLLIVQLKNKKNSKNSIEVK